MANKHISGGSLISLLQPFVNPPKIFDDEESISRHIEKMETYFKTAKIDSKNRAAVLFSSLSESTQLLLESFDDCNVNCETWMKHKLRECYEVERTRIQTMKSLLFFKQKPNQPLRNFANDVRVEVYKVMGKSSTEQDRQKLMVDVFLSGIINQTTSKAIKKMGVYNLNECVTLALEDVGNKETEEETLAAVSDDVNLQSKVVFLEKEVSRLSKLVSSLMSKRFDAPKFNAKPTLKTSLKCFNCNSQGFIANECIGCPKKMSFFVQPTRFAIKIPYFRFKVHC